MLLFWSYLSASLTPAVTHLCPFSTFSILVLSLFCFPFSLQLSEQHYSFKVFCAFDISVTTLLSREVCSYSTLTNSFLSATSYDSKLNLQSFSAKSLPHNRSYRTLWTDDVFSFHQNIYSAKKVLYVFRKSQSRYCLVLHCILLLAGMDTGSNLKQLKYLLSDK